MASPSLAFSAAFARAISSSGQILIGGEDVTRLPPSARDVSMVFQSYALFPHMTVMENVSYGLVGLPKAAQREKAQEGLRLVGLPVAVQIAALCCAVRLD